MELLVAKNKTITEIVRTVKQFESLDQAEVLAYVRALKMKKNFKAPIAKYDKKVKPLSMKEIDRIKHLVRKQHAGK